MRRVDLDPRAVTSAPRGALWLVDLEPSPDAVEALGARLAARAPRRVLARSASRAARHPAQRAAVRLGGVLAAGGAPTPELVDDLATGLRRLFFSAAPGTTICLLGHDADGAARRHAGFRRALLAGRPLPRAPFARGTCALAAEDPAFRHLAAAVGPVTGDLRPSSFETLARAIVYQQISGHAARAIWERVVALFGGTLDDPAAVLRRRETTLRRAGLSGAKAAALRDLARHVSSGALDVPGLAGLPDEEVVRQVTQVRGFGPWSAQMHLLFSLGRPDVWPTGDLGVRKGLGLFLGRDVPPDERETEHLGARYAPWRSALAWYLWRRTEL